MGPQFFLVYINALTNSLHTNPRLVSVTSFLRMENLANVELKKIAEWMLSIGVTLHTKKTLALNNFPYVRKPNSQLTLTLNNDY